MDTPTMTTPEVVPGQGTTPVPPQATVTPPQEGFQPQPQPEPRVDGSSQPTNEEPPQRASDYETARQIKRLTKQVQSLMQTFERSSQSGLSNGTPQTPRPQVTEKELIEKPLDVINRMLDEREQRMMGQFPQILSQRETEMRHERAIQEGWKIIKSNEGFKRDPQAQERIDEIINEEDENGNSLQKYSQFNPIHAAKIAIETYNQRYGGQKTSAATKAQMVSTATASYPGGNKVDIGQEALKLQKEAMDNPDLMASPEWRARLESVKKQFNQAKFGTPNP